VDSINPWIVFWAWLPISYISIFAHELGHALAGRGVGFVPTSLGLGVGRPFAVFSVGRTRIYFSGTSPFQGITFGVPPLIFPTRRTYVPFLAGGIFANALLMVVALALWRWLPWGASVWFTAAATNALLAISSLLPYEFRVGKSALRTDGRQILQILRDGVISIPAPQVVQSLNTLRPLFASISDHTTLRLFILSAAAGYSDMEDYDRGEALLSELESLSPSDIPAVQARDALIRSVISSGQGKLDDAENALSESESLFRAIGDDGGLLCVTIQRLSILILRHDAQGAADELSMLTSHRFVKHGSWFQNFIQAVCVEAHAANSDVAGAEKALGEYEATRGRRPMPSRDLLVYRGVARLRSRSEDWVGAETAYRRAFAAINEVADSWPDADEHSRFIQRQSPFLDEARQCFKALNKVEEAEKLLTPPLSAEEAKRRVDDAPMRRHRRLLRAGLLFLLFNVLCIAGMLALDADPRTDAGRMTLAGIFVLTSSTIIAALYVVFHFAIGRFIPRLRHSGGAVILLLACMPWVTLLFVLLTPKK
jgi:tetratricopeptide (TPR) repeat protein